MSVNIRNPNTTQDTSLELTDAAQLEKQKAEIMAQERMNRINLPLTKSQIDSDMGPIWALDGTVNNNYTEQDFTYNSKSDSRAPAFNEWTRTHDDSCSEENRLRIGTKPLKYYVNLFNSPETTQYTDFTLIGNQKAYHVRNQFERAEPTRLNPLYPSNVEPYRTTGFLGQVSDPRMYSDTVAELRFGTSVRELKGAVALGEKDYNRFNPNVHGLTVQNAGQFQQQKFHDGYFDYHSPNNVSLGNDAVFYGGVSSRNLMDNILDLSKC